MNRFDLLDVIRTRLEGAKLGKAFTTWPDSRKNAEAIVVSLGLPISEITYYDGSRDIKQTINVYVRRIGEQDAMQTTDAVGTVLRTADLTSFNGSYAFTSIETQSPRPFAWDESGRFIWAIGATLTLTRKD